MTTSILIRKIKGYDYKGFLRKQTHISPLMQDVLIVVFGAAVTIAALIYESENQDTLAMLFVVFGALIFVYGLFLMVLTITKNTALAATSWLKQMYGIRVDSHLKDWIMTVCVREAREAKGVSLLFLLMILGIGFLLGLFFRF